MLVDPPSKERVLELAKKHIARYENQLSRAQRGERGYRLEENRHYLDIWCRIAVKGGVFDQLNDEEMDEVIDAIMDEES